MFTYRYIGVPLLATLLTLSSAAGATDKSLADALREARIEGQIVGAFALNRHLKLFEFDIDVEDSTVILSGSVEESIDKDLAEQVALGVPGVTDVDSRITIEPEMAVTKAAIDPAGKRDFATTVADATITASVKSRLMWNRHTDGLAINVDTHRGIVSLQGKVATSATKDLAGRLAENTDGVREVENQLRVAADGADAVDKAKASLDKAGHTVSDSWITARVKSSFMYSKTVDGTDIHVETRNGVVKLRGVVNSRSALDMAVAIARDTRGVRDVDASNLKTVRQS